MTIQQLTQTDSFTIEYDDAFPSARRRALALSRTVERDTSTLCGWFGVANPLNPGNRGTVRVKNLPTSLGDNYGYQAVGFGTLIEILPLEGASDEEVADDFARAIFVAELTEVLMDVRANAIGHRTWNRADSAGEALSTVCEELLYQDACLQFAAGGSSQGFPRGQFWLTNTPGIPGESASSTPWPDFVSTIDGTDGHSITFGCGILFIAFLMGQRGKSIGEIIQADGMTLEEKFHNLTGESDGFSQMVDALSQFFPRPAPAGALHTDFPFPLLPAGERSLSISTTQTISSSAVIGSGQVTVTLPFPCQGTTDTDYTVTENGHHIRLTAFPRGFANPTYEWYLIPATGAAPIRISDTGTSTSVAWSTVVVDTTNPTAPRPLPRPRSVQVAAAAPETLSFGDTQAPIGVLELDVSGGLGDVLGTIECHATDGLPAPATTVATTYLSLRCRQVSVDDQALRKCRERAAKLVHNRIPPFLHSILPDPPPDLRAAIQILSELERLSQNAAKKGDKEMHGLVRSVMTDTLQVPSALLPAEPLGTK